jgi:hypothetical protein
MRCCRASRPWAAWPSRRPPTSEAAAVEECRQGYRVMVFVWSANFARRVRNPRGR